MWKNIKNNPFVKINAILKFDFKKMKEKKHAENPTFFRRKLPKLHKKKKKKKIQFYM